MFKDGRYSPPQSAVFTGYSSTSAAELTCIHQRASDTDESSYGAVSGEIHGRTLVKLYVF
jgi:hypothetical protein